MVARMELSTAAAAGGGEYSWSANMFSTLALAAMFSDL